MQIVTRFAPSPTGLFHAGSYRTALFSWLYARHNNGKFILRIEDTDKQRSKKEYEDNIIDSLNWLGLRYDAFYRQSERTGLYKDLIKKLIDRGLAYVSKEAPPAEASDNSDYRSEVIRFKNPNKRVKFEDIIRGTVEFDTTELGDFVIAKSEDEPIFHLVNVIDDHDNGVTHVIRGEEHISNTPRQILIYEALGYTPPIYAHIPLLLAPDRSKLSKRHGALPITVYRDKGYLPAALVNYMSLLGWHPSDDREIMSLDEIIREFSLDRVQKGGAIFDEEKLNWFNRQYMLRLNDAEFLEGLKKFVPDRVKGDESLLAKLVPLLKDKIVSFGDASSIFEEGKELDYVFRLAEYPADLLLWKKDPSKESALKHLHAVRSKLESLDDNNFSLDAIKSAIWPYAEENGKGNVLWPMRVALTGKEKSPDPIISAVILGKSEALKRMDSAILKIS